MPQPPLIARLNESGEAAKKAGGHAEGLSFKTVAARRELIVLAHELSQGQFSRFGGSMMVLAEQTGAASLLFSAAGIAALALTAAVVGVGYAVIKGATEQRAMNNALIETGNYAGVTGDALNAMAHEAVEAGGSLRQAKKAVTELAASGKFTGDQIGYISEAAVAMEHATGKSIEKTIKEFETLAVQTSGNTMRTAEVISRAALKLDDTYHFLTESIYEEIRALEKEGDQKGASALATETLARVTKERAEEMSGSIGTIGRGWNNVKEAVNAVVDAIGNVGKKPTPAMDVEKYKWLLTEFDSGLRFSNEQLGRAPDAISKEMAESRLRIVMKLVDAVDKLNKADAAAIEKGQQALAQSEASHAASRIEQDDIRLGKKGVSELDDAIQKYGQDLAKIAAVNPGSKLLDQDSVNQHMALLVKAHTAETRGNDDRARVLQNALTNEQTALDREKSIYDARGKMLDLYHSKFGLADAEFYAGREAARAEYIAAEAISFAKEAGLVNAALAQARNPQEVAEAKAKYAELLKAHRKFQDDMRNAAGQDSADAAANERKLFDDRMKAITTAGAAEVKSLDEAIAKQREHNAEIGKTAEQIQLARQAKTDSQTETMAQEATAIEALLHQVDLQGVLVGQDRELYAARLAYLNIEIEKRRELASLLASGAVLEANAKAADEAAKAWKRAANTIENDLTAAILDGGGKGWKKLVREMEIAFAKMILHPILEPVAGSLASFAGSFMGNQTIGTAGAAGAASSNGLLGAANTASSLYNTGKGLTGLLNSAGTFVAGFGNLVGSSSLSAFGAGLAGNSAGTTMTAAEMFQSMGMTTEASAAGYGAAAGSALGVLGGVAGGVFGGRAISGGYGSNGAVNSGTAIGAAVGSIVPVIGTALGALAGGLLGGAYNRLFGRKAPEIESQGIRGVIRSDGVSGQSYQNIIQKGGLFRSDKRDVKAQALDDQMSSQIGQAFLAVTDASSIMAKSLGLGAEALTGYSKNFDIKLTDDATKNQEALTAFFTGIADEVATKLVPNLAQFSQVGESASATLQRLASEFDATTAAAQNIGKTAAQAFGSVGMESAAARERLVQLAGGASSLTSLTASYANNYLTEAQRLAPVSKALDDAFGQLGLSSIPTTRAEFSKLIGGLDLTNEAQAKQFVSLMQLSDAFAALHPATEALAKTMAQIAEERTSLQDQLDELTMSPEQLLKKQRSAIDDSNKSLFDQVHAAQQAKDAIETQNELLEIQAQIYELNGDKAGATAVLQQQHAAALAKLDPALRAATEQLWSLQAAAQATSNVKTRASDLLGGVDSAFSALQSVVEREKKAVQSSIDVHQVAVDLLQGLSDAITSTLGSMRTTEQQLADRAQAQAEIRADLAITRAGGKLSDAQVASLKTALGAVTQDASSQFSTYYDYLRDLYETQSDIAQLGDVTDNSLSVEKAALDTAQKQLESLDATLTKAQEQVDVLKGINTTGLSIEQAISALASSIASAQANPVVASGAAINNAYQTYLGRAPDSAGLQWWQNQIAAGVPQSSVTDAIKNSAEATNRAAIQQMYQQLLGRPADEAGLGFFARSGASLSDVAFAIRNSDEYKKMHPFAVGTNQVPEDMPAYIHKDERIIPAADNRELIRRLEAPTPTNEAAIVQQLMARISSSDVSSSAVLKALEAIRVGVEEFHASNSAENTVIAKGAQESAEHLDAAINGDKPLAMKVVTA